jgi:hypothetical protein
MSINFPDAPVPNQIHSAAGVAWKWDGYKWIAWSGPLPGDVTNIAAGAGLVGGGAPDAFGNVTIGLEIPVTIAHGGTSATTAGQALLNLGGFPITGGTITGSVAIQGYLNVNNDLGVGGNISTPNQVTAGRLYSSGDVVGHVFYGGLDGQAGTLQTWNTTNKLTFNYDSSSGGGELAWRIDGGAVQKWICNSTNWRDLSLVASGGPTTTAVVGYDIPGNAYFVYVDVIVSDERIKENIAPTQVDALSSITGLEVSEYDVKGPAVGWFANVDKDTAGRLAAMADAEPVHVPIGFVAQRIKDYIPEAVVSGLGNQPEGSPIPHDALNIVSQEMIPYIVRAIQQLSERLDALEARGRK